MQGFKPNPVIWSRVNKAVLGESAAVVLITMISGMCQMLIAAGVCRDENHARAHLAAMLLSPDNAPRPGSLVPMLQAELALLNDGKWMV